MLKPDSLRAALVAALPVLGSDPDRLRIWVDKGRVASRRTDALGFEWRYRLNILLVEFGGSPDAFMVPLLIWLRDAQPETFLNFQRSDEAVTFEADIIDVRTWDVLVRVELTEAVALQLREDRGRDIVHLPEPSADELLLDGAGETPLGAIWLGDEQLLP